MHFYDKGRLEDMVIQHLLKGPVNTKPLVVAISKKHNVTIQGVYKALRHLIEDEIVVKHAHTVSLNLVWIRNLGIFSEEIASNYEVSGKPIFPEMEEGDRVSFTFKSLIDLDVYWMHIMTDLFKNTKKPVFLYTPHQCFLDARSKTESGMFQSFEKEHRQTYVIIGHDTELDKKTAKSLASKYIQTIAQPMKGFKETHHITVVDDYIQETILEPELAEKINEFYNTTKVLTDEKRKILANMFLEKRKIKLTVMRNKAKANKIRKMLSKDLYIPKETKIV